MSVLKIKDQNNDWIQIPTIKGEKGDPFTYADFTPEQLESLKGKDGISPTVSVASDTSDDYRLSFTDETHTVTTPNLIPEAEKIFDVYPHDTASGAVASFTDGADNIPLKSCIVQIEPVQDLHGYDSPWPAGGGTNQWDEQWELGGIANADGTTFNTLDRIRSKNFSPCKASTTYYGCSIIGAHFNVYWYDTAKGFILWESASNKTITSPSTAAFFKVVSTDTKVYTSGLAINYPSTVTTYSPYENICPISGWTGCEVNRAGVNLFGGEAFRDAVLAAVPTATTGEDENGRYVTITASSASHEKVFFEYPWKENTVYTFIYRYKKNNTNGITNLSIKYKDGTYNYLARYGGVEADTVYTEVVKSVKYKLISDVRAVWGSGTATIYYDDFGVFEGDISVDDFVPYIGQTYPITFPAEAGTVYGGYIDPINGELVVDRAIVEYDGSSDEHWGEYGNDSDHYCCVAYPSGKASGYQKSICNEFKNQNNAFGSSDYGMYSDHPNYTNTYFRMPNAEVTTKAEFLAWIAENPIHLCYELATPITYQLTSQEIKTLLGQNNLWADCGDTEVEYRADTKLYIDNLTRSTEDDMTANTNISKDAYFTIGNTLYKASTAISKGETIVPNTNCTIVSLADALNTLTALTGGN